MRKDTLVIRDGRSAFVFPENGTELILVQLPRFRDCPVNQMLEVANRLPKDFALLLDTKAGCFRILQVAHASFLDALKCGVIRAPPRRIWRMILVAKFSRHKATSAS